MLTNYAFNKDFKKYGNCYEILDGIQINEEYLQKISGESECKEIVLKFDNIKVAYKFDFVDGERFFTELQIRGRFNRVLFVAYKGDYIVRDKTGIYILNKQKFEERYSMLNYEKAKLCS